MIFLQCVCSFSREIKVVKTKSEQNHFKFNDFFLQEKPPLGDFESISNFILKSDKHIHNDNNIQSNP